MSMHEAIRAIRGKLPWLDPAVEPTPDIAPAPTAAEEAADLARMANARSRIDRSSGTWVAVCAWAAGEIIEAHAKLETATEPKSTELRARIRCCRDLIAVDDRAPAVAEDQEQDMP